jgi:4-amino-4-deoxy-L-arabinose transferase-like glycosyltransferase
MKVSNPSTHVHSAPTIISKATEQKEKKIKRLTGAALTFIILLGMFLRFYQLGKFSVGNTYYAATVQSMLMSWKNFFFAAFEPGGSVTVDKPPLGFWIQAVSASIFGVNGFALALPQALAGTLSIPLLFIILKNLFGRFAGLIGALVLAVMPVTIATERNNTIDGLLVFVLLLATWAFLKSIQSGKFRFLLLGAFLIGIGFNIKMLQAFMPLPALYAIYLFGAKHNWWKRILHLAAASMLLVVVSFSWAIAVDLTDPANRPYIGSSENNTVTELIFGHNGLSRLLSNRHNQPQTYPLNAPNNNLPKVNNDPNAISPRQNVPGQQPARPGQNPPVRPPQGNNPPANAPGNLPNQADNPNPNTRSSETGEPGVLRLFEVPLVDEASWLLPFALFGILLVLAFLGWQWPLSNPHLGLLLWTGWLLPAVFYFSFTTGLFHAYYLIMLGPALAGLTAAVVWALGKVHIQNKWLGWLLTLAMTGLTLAFQFITARNYPEYTLLLTLPALAIFIIAGILLLAMKHPDWTKFSLALMVISMLAAPFMWSVLTVLKTQPDVGLPNPGPASADNRQVHVQPGILSPEQEIITQFLLNHTDPDSYLLATSNANQAAPYILATLRPVLTFGGFKGSDDVIDLDGVVEMVSNGELRYILGVPNEKPEIAQWMKENCPPVDIPGLRTNQANLNRDNRNPTILFDCAP